MPVDDECVDVIDGNNNEGGESARKADDEEEIIEEASPGFEVIEERNVKDMKVLLSKDKVVLKMITLGLPLLWSEIDIINAVFPPDQIVSDELGYRHVEDAVERKIDLIPSKNPYFDYAIHYHSPEVRLDPEPRPVSFEAFDDCHVVEQAKKHEQIAKAKSPSVRCSSPESVDSDETIFEGPGAININSQKDYVEEDFSYLDEKNDIELEKKDENYDDLFDRLSDDDHEPDQTIRVDDEITEAKTRIVENLFEIDSLRFYSSSSSNKIKSPASQRTIQLSESPILSGPRSKRRTQSQENVILAVYPPPPARGGIAIYKDNYNCLAENEYLNDVIIDFYLKYLTTEVLSEDDKKRTHVFSSQFFTRLSKPLIPNGVDEVEMTESERRHLGVKNWTKNVNIFEKDFIIVPINENHHWNLAIICFPYLVGMLDEDTESMLMPCILFFDSLFSSRRDRITAILRGYLKEEYLSKTGEEKSFANSVMKIKYPKVPLQRNATDCGLFVLQYVEQFFKNPIVDFTGPLDLSNWFKRSVIKRKRSTIASLIVELASNYNSSNKFAIPVLKFPLDSDSSAEEDAYCPSSKRKNPLFNEKCASLDRNGNFFSNEKSYSSGAIKKRKSNQTILDNWIRDAALSNDHHLDTETIKCQDDKSDDLMDVEKDDVLIDRHNTSDKMDKSLEILSNFPSPNKSSSRLNCTVRKYSKIGLMKENFSGRKSHIFQKSSIFSNESEKSSFDGTRQNQKRESQTNTRVDKMVMMALKSEIQEKRTRKMLKTGSRSEVDNKASKWFDDSDFKPSEDFYKHALFRVDDGLQISPSVPYKQFKIHKKITGGSGEY